MSQETPQRPSPADVSPWESRNAFTVDVEDYFQVSAFEGDIDRAEWDRFPQRVADNTLRLLEKLAAHDARATFFVLGWVAQRNPDLIAEISRAGHEIGSHSYWHRLIYQMSPEEFRQDLQLSRRSLEEITGQPVRLFRAPSFSITQRSLWALEILVEEGITVDSSVFPIYHDRYGIPGATPHIHCQQTPAGPLWEFPPTVVRWAGFHLPVSGGGYFRLYPRRLTCGWLRKVNQKMGQPFVFYVHPWELDPQQPRLSVGSRVSRWRHYLNLASTSTKLDHLLSEFRFGTVSEVLSAWMATSSPR